MVGRTISVFVLGLASQLSDAAQLHTSSLAGGSNEFDTRVSDTAVMDTQWQANAVNGGIQWDEPGPWKKVKHVLDDGHNVCAGGKQLPDLYVLGVQKCGTSTLAKLLAGAGVQIAHSPDNAKELHFFNMPIKLDYSLEWAEKTGRHWTAIKKDFLPMIKWEGSSLTENRKSWQDYYMPDCPTDAKGFSWRQSLADFTPDYIRIVPKPQDFEMDDHWRPVDLMNISLPMVMRKMYGTTQANKLQFVVMLRRPLAQLQSAWYMAQRSGFVYCRSCKGVNFQSTLQKHLKRMQEKKLSEWLWTAMYARQLEEWTAHFSSKQFYIMPMGALRKEREHVNICKDIANRTNFPIGCHEGDIPATFAGVHPLLKDDIDESSVLYKMFLKVFTVENDRLIKKLTDMQGHGAGLANYHGGKYYEKAVREWLLTEW